MRILILEDAQIGGRLAQEVNRLGLECTWFVGVKSLQGTEMIGFLSDLSEKSITLENYGLAFVDGFLYINGLMGWNLLPQLKDMMFTVGTSSLGEIGAHTSIEKDKMVESLADLILQAKGQLK